ncbi:MAG: TMEM175 family protein, partial [Tepidiformaceae bacterium]
FAYIGIYWNNHHHLFRATERISGGVMWANLHLLFWLSLIPVLTEWVGTDYHHGLPAAAYGAGALGAGIAYGILVRTILAANPPPSLVATAIGGDFKGNGSIVVYAIGMGLAFLPFGPWLGYACFVSVAVVWFIPDRRLTGRPKPPAL